MGPKAGQLRGETAPCILPYHLVSVDGAHFAGPGGWHQGGSRDWLEEDREEEDEDSPGSQDKGEGGSFNALDAYK